MKTVPQLSAPKSTIEVQSRARINAAFAGQAPSMVGLEGTLIARQIAALLAK